jgi:hypothetical protein
MENQDQKQSEAIYPAYFKASDIEGKAIALIVHEDESNITVIQHNAANGATSFTRVATTEDVMQRVGGQIDAVDTKEYDDILFNQFRFQLSEHIFSASITITTEEATDNAGLHDLAGSGSGSETNNGDNEPSLEDGASSVDGNTNDEAAPSGGEGKAVSDSNEENDGNTEQSAVA